MKKMKIVFAPNNKIGYSSYKLIEEVYGTKEALLTNLSSLYDFEESLDEIPGHKLIRFVDLPHKDRRLYKKNPDIINPKNLLVWYPPLTKNEQKEIGEAYRRTLLKKLERFYRISFADYPNDELYVWQVAEFTARKQYHRLV